MDYGIKFALAHRRNWNLLWKTAKIVSGGLMGRKVGYVTKYSHCKVYTINQLQKEP